MVQLNTTKYPNNARTVSGTPTIRVDDVVLNCNTSNAPVIINLLTIPAGYWSTLWKLYIFDTSDNAGTNNITINAPSGFKINNASSLVLNTNGAGCIIRIVSDTNFISSTTTAVNSQFISSVADTTTNTLVVSSGGQLTANAIPDSSTQRIEVQKDGVAIGARKIIDFNTGAGIDLTVTENVVQNRIEVTSALSDTGWIDLGGFAFITTPSLRPQYRIIGKKISFRGQLIVPLNNAGSVVPYASESSYMSFLGVTPFSGSGGVVINPLGSIIFNNDTPVFSSASHYPDSTYATPFTIGTRRMDTTGNKIGYTGLFAAFVTSAGKLGIGTVRDFEDDASSGIPFSSLLSMLTSKATINGYILDYSNINRNSTLQGTTEELALPLIPSVTTTGWRHAVTIDASESNQIGGFQLNINQLNATIV